MGKVLSTTGGGVLLEEALKSNNYVIADSSHEWFCYLRMRHPKMYADNEFLRNKFHEFVQIKPTIKQLLDERLLKILPNHFGASRMVAICMRGTDYKTMHHMVQPQVKDVCDLARKVFVQYYCDYYFVATEDAGIYNEIRRYLPEKKLVTYNAGNISNSEGLIGPQIRKDVSADKAALDYLTTLYCMDKSVCLVGGLCGATIVAKYRRDKPYEYINIIDMKEMY